MPIDGLTDSPSGSGFPVIAVLHKGEKRTEAMIKSNRIGRDLNHFRIEFDPKFEYLRPVWEKQYGQSPTFFDPVYVGGQTVEEAFGSWLEEWGQSGLYHRCTGEYQVLKYHQTGEQAGYMSKARVACERNVENGPGCRCVPIGRLSLIFPEFLDAAGVYGYITATTHSIHDLKTIGDTLFRAAEIVAAMRRRLGHRGDDLKALMMVPFRFGRAPEEITAPMSDRATGKRTGKRITTQKSLFYLHFNEDFNRQVVLPAYRDAITAPWLPAGMDDYQGMPQLPEGSTPRERLSNVDRPRRIGPAIVKVEPVLSIEPPAKLETVEGEEVDDQPKPAPTSTATLTGPKWSAGDQRKWSAKQHLNGLTDRELLTALGVDSYDQFEGSAADADQKLDVYIEAKMAVEPEPAAQS